MHFLRWVLGHAIGFLLFLAGDLLFFDGPNWVLLILAYTGMVLWSCVDRLAEAFFNFDSVEKDPLLERIPKPKAREPEKIIERPKIRMRPPGWH